jgi:hypothetical protein
MGLKSGLVAVLFVFAFALNGYAQERISAAESVERLKAQLLDLQITENDLRSRLENLNEEIKPENIERSLAGVGSTRPEELREARRRQLEIERNGVLAQLNTLETSRARLQTAFANAEVLAYQESALPMTQQALRGSGRRYQWFIFGGGGGLTLLALGGSALLYRRKKRLRQQSS